MNEELQENNRNRIKSLHRKIVEGGGGNEKRKILYVVYDLASVGGTETRLGKQLKYLSEHNFKCMILTSRGNAFAPLVEYPNFKLTFEAENFTDLLIEILSLAHIDFIEFQVKEAEYLRKINYSKLRKHCKIGLCIHNNLDFNNIDFDWFDYILRANATFGYNFLEEIPHIPNWVEKTSLLWEYKNQKEALFISRLSNEKLPTLASFIKACNTIGCDFQIAGNIIKQKINTEINSLVDSLCEGQYIGPINTQDFLEKNSNDFLFIGGVGQVPIEAASFGIPALVCTHLEDFTYSRFVTKENIDDLITNNFVINTHRYIPDSHLGNISHFMDCIKNRYFLDFQVTREIEEKLLQESAMEKYLAILNNPRN
ncbi:MAG: hypothetical protein NC112_04545 [Oxalobacter formigenes]|nr:hypothetical protein [Oxalobacter formigenes]